MDTRRTLHQTLVRLPDVGVSLLFVAAAVVAAGDKRVAELIASGLSVWFVYEYYGASFLLLWVALNENRRPARKPDQYRVLSACAAYLGCALLMLFVFHLSPATVTMSAVGGIWSLLNPFFRDDAPTAFQIGRETALSLVALLLCFLLVTLFASVAEQVLPRPFHRATFDAVTIAAIGAAFYLVRWLLVARFAPPERTERGEVRPTF